MTRQKSHAFDSEKVGRYTKGLGNKFIESDSTAVH